MIFAFIYWFATFMTGTAPSDMERLNKELATIEAKRLADSAGQLSDAQLWDMSKNKTAVDAGEKVYYSICVTCHGENLEGGIGLPLIKNEWVHGGHPTDLIYVLNNGVPDKGMPAWGKDLGPLKTAQVVSFVLSKNNEAELRANYPDQEPESEEDASQTDAQGTAS
jgi:cytochrome c oxidase cbb3-type subunit 3